MPNKLTKVRVQIIDKETKLPKEDVDVMTSSDAVLFPDGESFQEKYENGEFKGETGDDGASATIKVGSTTTLNAGSQAKVENIGTTSAAVLSFYIPKGDKGDDGTSIKILGRFDTEDKLLQAFPDGSDFDGGFMVGLEGNLQEYYYWDNVNNKWTSMGSIQGPKGETGDKGDTGKDGIGLSIINSFNTYEELIAYYPDGSVCGGSGCVTTNTGEYWYWNYISNKWTSIGSILGIEGPKGDKGDPATVSIEEVNTVGPDQDATVENVGTPSDVRLVFNIPKGEQGKFPDIDSELSKESSNPVENKVITIQIDDLTDKINYLNNYIDNLEDRLSALIDTINNIATKLDSLTNEVDKLKLEINELEIKTSSLIGDKNISDSIKLI